ncbi:MAG TPA: hypothetical protein PK566_16315 [Pseudobacteroides sp.]|nr:hypothetical protein [Pseudobacteroides sp.]
MNIRYLHEILSRIEEIKVIGRNVMVDGVICNVMGIVHRDMEMRLLILQYDENFRDSIEEIEATKLFDAQSIHESNRMLMRNDRKVDAKNPFQSVLKVLIGEREFKIEESVHHRLSMQDWDNILTIAKFMNNGWQPNQFDYQNIDMLFLTSLKLVGDFISIPEFNQNDKLRFVMGPDSVIHQVEKPITLVVGGSYPDKLMFQDAATGVEHWAQINRVYLLDIWDEMEKILAHPKLQEQMTSEEIAQRRLDLEKKLLEICPKGLYLPVIEYECEEDIFLQFYSKSFLDAKPLDRGNSVGLLFQPDQPTGTLGLKLKAAVLQEPVPADTSTIEVELFQYISTITNDDIVL